MKIAAMSDTHNRHKKVIVPDCDVLIHAGDATSLGKYWECVKFLRWFSEQQPQATHIFVPGNHDRFFEENPVAALKECRKLGIHCLMNSGMEVDGVKVWGIPDTPWFCDWAFNRGRNAAECFRYNVPLMKDVTDIIPNDTDIIVSHGPAYGILDELVMVGGDPAGRFVGCEDILGAVNRVKPDLFFCGHIHCGYGQYHFNGTSFYNVSVCGETYTVDNEVTVVEYEKVSE